MESIIIKRKLLLFIKSKEKIKIRFIKIRKILLDKIQKYFISRKTARSDDMDNIDKNYSLQIKISFSIRRENGM